MLPVSLALGSAVSFGVADFIGGSTSRRIALPVVLAVSQAAGLLVIGSVVAVRGTGPPEARYIALSVVAGLAGTIGLAALYAALAAGPMSIVAPIAGTAAIVPVIAGFAIGEAPSAVQNGGILLAFVGVVLASRANDNTDGQGRRGVWLAVLAAVVIGCFLLVLDAASEGDPVWASFLQRTASTSILWLSLLALRPSLTGVRAYAIALPVVGILDVAGNTLFAVATTKGLIGIVSVVASLYPVVTVALARFLHHERLSRLQAVGVAAAFAGVALIAVG
jgi:drug/metabolite transporter (DMT)-like permease